VAFKAPVMQHVMPARRLQPAGQPSEVDPPVNFLIGDIVERKSDENPYGHARMQESFQTEDWQGV